MGRATRQEWAKRVERWVDSGLTAAEFAAEMGINARTLTYWKYQLKKEAGSPTRKTIKAGQPRARPRAETVPPFVQVEPAAPAATFDVEVGDVVLRLPLSITPDVMAGLLGAVRASC